MPELISVGTTVPMIRPIPRKLDASRFGTKPDSSIAFSTRALGSGLTISGFDRTRDTVIGATPASSAISRTPILSAGFRLFSASCVLVMFTFGQRCFSKNQS